MKTRILSLSFLLALSISTFAAPMVLNVWHTSCGRTFSLETTEEMTAEQALYVADYLEETYC